MDFGRFIYSINSYSVRSFKTPIMEIADLLTTARKKGFRIQYENRPLKTECLIQAKDGTVIFSRFEITENKRFKARREIKEKLQELCKN